MQSAFNEARRAAITQRSKNYLVFFRQPDDSRPDEYVYGMRRYRERVGYEGEAHFLLPGVMFDIRQASVQKDIGIMAVLFEGEEDEIKAAHEFLKEQGVRVDPVEGGSIVAG